MKKILTQGDRVIWAGKPHLKLSPIIDEYKYLIPISILIPGLISIIFYFLSPPTPFEMKFLVSFLIFLVGFIGIFVVTSSIRENVQWLKNASYFLTKERMLSITNQSSLINRRYITNVSLSEVEYFFFKLKEESSMPIYSIYFKLFELYGEELRKIFQETYLSDQEIKYQEGDLPKLNLDLIIRWDNIQNIEEIIDILKKLLPNKLREPPEDWIDRARIFRAHRMLSAW